MIDKPDRRRALMQGAALLAALAARVPAAIAQQAEGEPERNIKAAYLYKFLGYVEWPPSALASATSPISVGVIGADDLAAELSRIVAGRTVNGREVAVVRLRRGDPLTGLHALFAGRVESGRITQLVRAAQPLSILVVTESEGALESGSVINFVRAGENVRFEISLDAAERSGLKLSSRLLAIATTVRLGPS